MVACCRSHWDRLCDQRSRAAILAAERYADGQSDGEALLAAARAANEACYLPDGQKAPEPALSAAHLSTYAPHTIEAFTNPPDRARPGFGGYAAEAFDKPEGFAALAWACPPQMRRCHGGGVFDYCQEWEVAAGDEFRHQADLLRDIFGNPFRPSPPLPRAVLAWNDGTVPRLAAGVYEERRLPEGTFDPARLAILADALLDGGCEDDDLIQHCRSDVPHVRGCWALDLVLGRG